MTPLEQAVHDAVAEQSRLLAQIKTLERDVEVSLEREAVLRGRIEQLQHELLESKNRADHYLQWVTEVTKQLHNVGIFVSDALHTARQEIRAHQGNGRTMEKALDAVEKALSLEDIAHEPVQHQGER